MVTQVGTSSVDGVITAANAKGVKLNNGDQWLNVSKFGDPVVIPPTGTQVRVGLDKSGFIRSIVPMNGGFQQSSPQYQQPPAQQYQQQPQYAPQQGGYEPEPPQNPAPSRDQQIARMNALTNAVACLASGGQVAEVGAVFDLAGEFEAWVLR